MSLILRQSSLLSVIYLNTLKVVLIPEINNNYQNHIRKYCLTKLNLCFNMDEISLFYFFLYQELI